MKKMIATFECDYCTRLWKVILDQKNTPEMVEEKESSTEFCVDPLEYCQIRGVFPHRKIIKRIEIFNRKIRILNLISAHRLKTKDESKILFKFNQGIDAISISEIRSMLKDKLRSKVNEISSKYHQAPSEDITVPFGFHSKPSLGKSNYVLKPINRVTASVI